jgi:translation initiation factor aIF-2/yIF-2
MTNTGKKSNNVTKPTKLNPMAKLALQRLQQVAEEDAKLKAEKDEEDRKIREEEEKIELEKKKKEELHALKKKKKEDKILAQKAAGTYMTKSQKEKAKKDKLKLDQMIKLKYNHNNTEKSIPIHILSESSSEPVGNYIKLRSVISCIMGHVDTGKTKILDKIRNTNVQDGEVGGITQQIGATFIPYETLANKIKNDSFEYSIDIPGLLMIDTPGHKAFENLRSMGSSLCDIAIIVVDLMHGLEPQTIESMNMLRSINTPFIIALNKIDRLYGFVKSGDEKARNIRKTLSDQDENCISEFNTRSTKIIVQIMEQGFNAKLYWENDSIEDTISICPTSAITGDGLPDLLMNLIKYPQNHTYMSNNISLIQDFNPLAFKCIIMDSSKIDGLGVTIDVILINGELNQGDRIIIETTGGPINTTIRSLLTPPSNSESRVTNKSNYIYHKSLTGAMGIKIVANNINDIITGSNITKLSKSECFTKEIINMPKDEPVEYEDVISDLASKSKSKIELQDKGVTVHASTLGSLEALLYFLQKECDPPIPVFQANIGNVMKKDVVKTNLSNTFGIQSGSSGLNEFKTILAFNVKIDEDAEIQAKENGVKIFSAEIIYHLFDQFKKHKETLQQLRKDSFRNKMIFPCILKILPDCIFNKKNPLVFGVDVIEGNLHIGTPLSNSNTYIGKVISIQKDHKEVDIGKKGSSVCIKVDNQENPSIAYGRHFDNTNVLCSKISRESLDVLKEHFKDDITRDDLALLVKLKKVFGII